MVRVYGSVLDDLVWRRERKKGDCCFKCNPDSVRISPSSTFRNCCFHGSKRKSLDAAGRLFLSHCRNPLHPCSKALLLSLPPPSSVVHKSSRRTNERMDEKRKRRRRNTTAALAAPLSPHLIASAIYDPKSSPTKEEKKRTGT